MLYLSEKNDSVDVSLFAGDLGYYPSNDIPEGWIKCQGNSLSPLTYPELFRAIGYSVGVDADLYRFKIPDWVDMLRVWNNGVTGTDANRVPFVVQADSVRPHSHDAAGTGYAGEHSHSIGLTGWAGGVGSTVGNSTTAASSLTPVKSGSTTVSSGHTHGVSLASTGSDVTAPPTTTLFLCICIGKNRNIGFIQ